MSLRADLLREAVEITDGDRQSTYGDAVETHVRAAAIFNAITGNELSASDIVTVLRSVKLARQQFTPDHRDTAVDLMAYEGIFYECVTAGK